MKKNELTMKKIHTHSIFIVLSVSLTLFSCKEFLFPEQEINITEERLYDDWYEYRAVSMGLYRLQANLTEQLVILGELRGDLLKVTEFADADLIEIYNFNVSKDNKYVTPTNFFKLISACNNFIRVLEKKHPEVIDPGSQITNYDRLYGEVLCMRAWAYFNAARIYGKVPFIHESLTTIEEVNKFLNSSGEYIDSVDITFDKGGFHNDTAYNTPISLDKQYYDQDLIIDYFTNELENKIKAVGVNHSINNNDESWEVTIWNTYAMHTLLGLMYLTEGNLLQAANHFESVIYNNSENLRYQLDETFSDGNWKNIFNVIDIREHILTADFNKGSLQQNELQKLFDPRPPHQYMLKPTSQAVLNWETIWDNFTIIENRTEPWESEIGFRGFPGDFYRGYGVSYAYFRNGAIIDTMDIHAMLELKADEDYRTSSLLVRDADTVVWKYSWNKDIYDQDADFIFYRATSVHLWLAEIYTYLQTIQNGILREDTPTAVGLLNDANNTGYPASVDREQMGVRGRVGFGGETDGARISDIHYIHHPFTNEIVDYRNLTANLPEKQLILEQYIMDERARELAFEGERFYDLIRVAKRRNDPSYLAKAVSEKFTSGKQEEIYNLLLNEQNWYINYFE